MTDVCKTFDCRKLWIKHCSDAAQEGVERLVFETAGLILL